jgi:hypothetical protein
MYFYKFDVDIEEKAVKINLGVDPPLRLESMG